MIVSVTERGNFRRCKQQWDYSSFNRQSIAPVVPPTALSFGSLVHKAHEQWLLNPDAEPSEVVLQVAVEKLKELKATYVERVGVEPEERELTPFFDQVWLAQGMMTNYRDRWGGPLPEGFTLVQPEQTILLPIPGTDHYHWDGHIHDDTAYTVDDINHGPQVCAFDGHFWYHQLEATLDALMQDSAGRLWVYELKTFGQHPKPEHLRMNDQFIGYDWAAVQVAQGGEVGGVLYDGMWKRELVSARKTRTLNELFYREPLIFSPDTRANFVKQLRAEVTEMANPDIEIYRNVPPVRGCWDCQFVPLCNAEFNGEDSDYIRKKLYTKREKHSWAEEDPE